MIAWTKTSGVIIKGNSGVSALLKVIYMIVCVVLAVGSFWLLYIVVI